MTDTMSQNILLVDDRPENLIVLENILEQPGLNLIKANSGEEALRLLLKTSVALILLDVQMPGMDGFETASILRGAPNTKHIPIIFVTAISKEEKNIFKGYQSGAVDYMFKPVDPDILKSKVDIFLELDRRKKIVDEKNFKLQEERKNTNKILNNVRNGLFILDSEFNFKPQYSTVLENILQQKKIANTNFLDFLDNKVPDKIKASCQDYLELIFEKTIPENTLDKLNPLYEVEMIFGNEKSGSTSRILSFTFKPIYNDVNEIQEIIATVADVTEKVTLAKKLQESEDQYKKQMELAFNILHVEPSLLKEFMEGLQRELDNISKLLKQKQQKGNYHITLEKVFRCIHLVKGNASLLDLKYFINAAHEFEEKIIEIQKNEEISGSSFLPLVMQLSELYKTAHEINELIERIRNIQTHFRPKRDYENSLFIQSIKNLINNTAGDLDKKVKFVHKNFDLGHINYENRLMIKEVLIQLIRNSICHGIENAEERKKSKKSITGILELSTFENGKNFGIKLRDDGRGLQIEQLIEKVKSTGKWNEDEIKAMTDDQIVQLIFMQGISTANKTDTVAGRGVGMTLIKEKLDKVKGTIEVNHEANKFCEFSITIPSKN